MAAPRLALAGVISIVVATPMTLRIFQHDIDNQMALQQTNESAQLEQGRANTISAKDLASVNAQITKWNNVLAGNLEGITASTPQLATDQQNVASLTAQADAAQAKMNAAYDKWNCERNGADRLRGGNVDDAGERTAGAERLPGIHTGQGQLRQPE